MRRRDSARMLQPAWNSILRKLVTALSHDLAAYKHFHTEILGALPQVDRLTTYVVMGSPKDDRA